MEVYLENVVGSEMTDRSIRWLIWTIARCVVGNSQVVLAHERLLSVVHEENAPDDEEHCPTEQKTFDRRLLRVKQEVTCELCKDGQEQTPHNGPARVDGASPGSLKLGALLGHDGAQQW